VFNTPIIVKGKSWFPLNQLVGWLIMTWVAGRNRPDRSKWQCLGVASLTTAAILGSEWCHNLVQVAAAAWIGKPMDALKIILGMPLVIYSDINDTTVTPWQHIIRALGGPLFNIAILPFTLLFRRFTRPASTSRDVATAMVGMNMFLSTFSLLPIPGIDGGPFLKWTMVETKHSIHEVDGVERKVDLVVGVSLAAASGAGFKSRNPLIGGFLAMFAVIVLG
jgi:Zn-dependent protease